MCGDECGRQVVWVGIGAGVIAISCATGNFPCKDDKNDSGTYTAPGASR